MANTQKTKFISSIGLNNWIQLDEDDMLKLRQDTAVIFMRPDDTGITIIWQKNNGLIFYSFQKYSENSIKKILMEVMHDPNKRGMTTPQQANKMLCTEVECKITIDDIEHAQSQETNNLSAHESSEPTSPDSQS